tara:strand:- start:183 stop:386 length:204 start_codon:yes stop_codon:yes gene_type:complete
VLIKQIANSNVAIIPEAPATPDGKNPSRPNIINMVLASIATAPAIAVSPPIALPPFARNDKPKTTAA